MISLPSFSVRVFLHAPPTDLRKGFDYALRVGVPCLASFVLGWSVISF